MSLWSNVKKGLELAQVCASAIEIIHQIIKTRPGKDSDLVSMIGKIVTNVREAISGERTVASVQADLEKLKTDLAKNDAAADAAVDDKFPKD
jgi:hypothetical protein